MDYYQGKEMPINTVKGQNRFLSGCTNRKIIPFGPVVSEE
jgi:hypothetical protein